MRHVAPEHLHSVEGLAQGRMKKKLLAAKEALERNVPTIVLADSRRAMPVRAALRGEGTVIGEPAGLETERLDHEGLLLAHFAARSAETVEVLRDR